MKKIPAVVLCSLFLTVWSLAEAPSLNTALIPVARTVSSIVVLELAGKSIGGIVVETPFFDDHPLAMAGLLNGDSSLLFTGSALAIRNSQAGGPLVQVATPVWDVSGLVTLDPALVTLADLKGKTLALPLVNGPLDLQTKAILKAAGLEGQVKIDYAEPAQAMALLLTKRVDAAGLPEPLVSSLVLLKGATEMATYAQLWAPLNLGDGRAPQVSLLAKRSFVAEHPGFLKALIVELRKVVAAVQADPKAYAAKYAPVLNLPVAVVARGLANTRFELPGSAVTTKLIASYLTLTGETRPVAADFFFQE